eukprot:gene7918-32676_t
MEKRPGPTVGRPAHPLRKFAYGTAVGSGLRIAFTLAGKGPVQWQDAARHGLFLGTFFGLQTAVVRIKEWPESMLGCQGAAAGAAAGTALVILPEGKVRWFATLMALVRALEVVGGMTVEKYPWLRIKHADAMLMMLSSGSA